MRFGKNKKNQKKTDDADSSAEAASEAKPTPSPTGADGPKPIPADRAVDLMADLLRVMGEHAFEVPPRSAADISEWFEHWTRHLLLGLTPPDREGVAPGQPADAGSPRDLPGLRRAFRDHRASEVEYVTSSLGDFRDAAWAFVSGMRRSLTIEQNEDRRIGHRMRRLEGAVRTGEAERIKDEAQETVKILTEFLAERGKRHQLQIQEMASKLEGLRDELDTVRKRATTDPVTKIYNRAAFDEQIEREIDLSTLFGWRGCLIMVDIDHFKWVNDTHGHPCGDEVLRIVADTLTRCFMRKDDFVARYGGEEFAILFRDIPLPLARDVAERGMNAIRNLEIEYEGVEEPIRITASMGIARLRPGETASSWIERADRALYAAKDGGRDRIEVDALDLEEA